MTTISDKDRYAVEWFMADAEGKEQKTVAMIHAETNSVTCQTIRPLRLDH